MRYVIFSCFILWNRELIGAHGPDIAVQRAFFCMNQSFLYSNLFLYSGWEHFTEFYQTLLGFYGIVDPPSVSLIVYRATLHSCTQLLALSSRIIRWVIRHPSQARNRTFFREGRNFRGTPHWPGFHIWQWSLPYQSLASSAPVPNRDLSPSLDAETSPEITHQAKNGPSQTLKSPPMPEMISLCKE